MPALAPLGFRSGIAGLEARDRGNDVGISVSGGAGRLFAACGLLAGAALAAAGGAAAATTSTPVLGSKGQSEQTCLQFLVFAVGQAENCTYGGVVFGIPTPFGESTGPFTVNYFYDSVATPQAFSVAEGNPNPFTPTFGDAKIQQRITGSVTIDDNDTPGNGADDRISFSLTFRSPGSGSIIRWLGANLVERYGSMSQTLAPTTVSRATPNLQGGFDYEIASRGFPPLLLFNAPGNDPSNGRTIGTVESVGSFTVSPTPDPLRWTPWPARLNPADPSTHVGFGSLEDNLGPRTTGSLTGSLETGQVDCRDPVPPPATGNCTNSKSAFSPLARGPNNAPGTPLGVTAEDVGFDQLLLKVSTNAAGRVVSVAGFDVQESQNFGANLACGSDPGATIRCNTWTTGYFTLAGVDAVDDGPFRVPNETPVELEVLVNDVNFLDPVTVTIPTPPLRGTAVVLGSPGNASGIVIEYTGSPGELGTDSFVYQVTDAVGNSDTATVSVEILDFSVGNDFATTRLNTPVDISVGANDIGFGPSTVVTINDDFSAGGSAVVTAGNGGPASGIVVRYTPVAPLGTPTYTETFTYDITDGDLLEGTGTVTVTVTNNVPAAVGGLVTVSTVGRAPTDSTGTFTVPGPGGVLGDAPVEIVVTNPPVNGTATITGNTITYAIAGATFFAGADVFNYQITDVDGETATAEVEVSVPNAVPVLPAGQIFVEQGRTSRPFRPALTFGNGSPGQHVLAITQQAQNGTCALTAGDGSGSVTYQGNAGFSGTDTCQIRLTDGNGDAATATVTITVAPVNEVTGRVGGASSTDAWSLLLLGGVLWYRRRRVALRARLTAAVAVALLPAVPLQAQDGGQDTPGPASPAPSGGVGEIIVTARKVAENLKDVPLSITVFDSATIAAAGINNLYDVAELTPGLSFFNAFGENLPIPVIRGVAPTDIFGQNNAAVFIDGVFISGREGINFSQLDFERIEVVKGPQSAQYGRTAFSGALNYVTKDPGDEFDAKIQAEAGNFGRQRGRVMLSGPILGETLTGRVNFQYDEWDGSYKNPLSDVDVGGYRYRSWQSKLLWKPVDDLRVSLAYYKSNDEIDDPAAVSLPANCEDRVDNTPEVRLQDFCGRVPRIRDVPTQQGSNRIKKVAQATGENRLLDRAILRGDWDVMGSGFTVTSLTGFLKTVQNNVADFGNNMGNDLPFLYCIGLPESPAVPNSCAENPANLRHFSGLYNPNADDRTDEWSQEFRFSSPQDQRLRYGGGLYVFSSKFTAGPGAQIATVPLPDLGPGAQPGLAPFDPSAPNFAVGTAIFWNTFTPDGGRDPLLRTVLREDTDSWAVFASADYDITDRLTALTEIRYVQESQVRRQYLYALCVNRTTPECGDDRFDLRVPNAAQVVRGSARFDSLIGRVGLRFRINDDWMVYGSIAEGEKPGGLRLVNANLVDNDGELIPIVVTNDFEPEKLTAYELGVKGVLFDRLSIDAAVFYNDWREIVLRQLQETDPATGGRLEQPVGFNVNAGDARVLGFELSTSLQITDRWRAGATLGWVDAELQNAAQDQFQTYPTFAPDGDVSGNKLLRQPEWDASASLSYDREFASDWKWYARGDVTYQSGVYVGNNNQSWLPDRTYVNARLGFRSARYTVEFWGRNLFNNEDPIAAFRDIFFTNTDSVVPPYTDLGPRPGFDKFPPLRYTVTYPRLRQVGINFEMRFGSIAQ
jgi:iron complex outermembrane receptor protein